MVTATVAIHDHVLHLTIDPSQDEEGRAVTQAYTAVMAEYHATSPDQIPDFEDKLVLEMFRQVAAGDLDGRDLAHLVVGMEVL